MLQKTQIKGLSKVKLIIILAMLSSIAPLTTDMYLPALANVENSFRTTPFLVQLSLTSFFIAFACGQLIYGPLSDIFGRKKPVLIGLCLFIASSVGCVLVDNIYHFIALRFFEALGGCVGVVIARAIVNDMFEIKEATEVFALMMIFSSLAPMLSPTFGGFILQYFSWHHIFSALFLLGIIVLMMVFFGLKESAPKIEGKKFSKKEILDTYKIVLSDRMFLVYNLTAAFALSAMFAYLTGSSFVFTKIFELNEQQFGILFGVNALGFVIFAQISARLAQEIDQEKILAVSLVLYLIGMLVLLGNSFFKPNFWIFEISLFTSLSMLGFIAPNTTTLAMARFKEHSGTASALLGFAQFALAGFISFVVGAVDANTPVILALVMSGCAIVANVLYFGLRKK